MATKPIKKVQIDLDVLKSKMVDIMDNSAHFGVLKGSAVGTIVGNHEVFFKADYSDHLSPVNNMPFGYLPVMEIDGKIQGTRKGTGIYWTNIVWNPVDGYWELRRFLAYLATWLQSASGNHVYLICLLCKAMVDAGVPLPTKSVEIIGDAGEALEYTGNQLNQTILSVYGVCDAWKTRIESDPLARAKYKLDAAKPGNKTEIAHILSAHNVTVEA